MTKASPETSFRTFRSPKSDKPLGYRTDWTTPETPNATTASTLRPTDHNVTGDLMPVPMGKGRTLYLTPVEYANAIARGNSHPSRSVNVAPLPRSGNAAR